VSAGARRKEKERRRLGPLRGGIKRAGGPKGKEVRFLFFFSFLNPFQIKPFEFKFK
jgi:hypothetical protein